MLQVDNFIDWSQLINTLVICRPVTTCLAHFFNLVQTIITITSFDHQLATVCIQLATVCIQLVTVCIQLATVCIQLATVCIQLATVCIQLATVCIQLATDLLSNNSRKPPWYCKLLDMIKVGLGGRAEAELQKALNLPPGKIFKVCKPSSKCCKIGLSKLKIRMNLENESLFFF